MVLDTSALMVIHRYEAERSAFRVAVTKAAGAVLPASAYIEFVLATKARRNSREWLDRLLRRRILRIEPISAAIASTAADAGERFGRGHHRAGLNFGDCLSYAVAKHLGTPLLYKGDGFVHTDIDSALPA